MLERITLSVSRCNLTVDRNTHCPGAPFRREARVPNSEGHHFRSLRQLFLMALNIWKVTPERAAVRLVRAILRDSPSPLTTKEIYSEAVRREAKREYPRPPTVVAGASAQQPAKLVGKRGVVHTPPPGPPHPENAVRSVQYVCISSRVYRPLN